MLKRANADDLGILSTFFRRSNIATKGLSSGLGRYVVSALLTNAFIGAEQTKFLRKVQSPRDTMIFSEKNTKHFK